MAFFSFSGILSRCLVSTSFTLLMTSPHPSLNTWLIAEYLLSLSTPPFSTLDSPKSERNSFTICAIFSMLSSVAPCIGSRSDIAFCTLSAKTSIPPPFNAVVSNAFIMLFCTSSGISEALL